ncbi:MAG TPA: D-isomer specific 2-hydroxyacid dehydrogenase family protein [Streptosporangiaceae bacterium]|nr:D-isomer specific 2-hydroxyacid dehydrogenase family protein [Streptosporangiaceae bacterium]
MRHEELTGPAAPRVAVGPGAAPWAADAIRRGGGEAVALDQDAAGLVWTDAGAMDALRSALATRPKISWVQLPQAGVERAFQAGVVDRQRRWTSAKGAFAEPVAEHALALILAGLRQLKVRAQARTWGQPAGESLFGQPVTVVGAGSIAAVLLRLLEPFGTPVTVVRRHAEPVPGAVRTLSTDRLTEALAGARAVVLTVALTPQTRGLIGRTELAAMEPDAWLVNVARGGVVDTEALVEALRAGQIGGAAVDVTDPEPLPAGHPLWDLPNCLITPHTADTEEMTRPLLAGRITENVRRLAAGQELVGLLDPGLGY